MKTRRQVSFSDNNTLIEDVDCTQSGSAASRSTFPSPSSSGNKRISKRAHANRNLWEVESHFSPKKTRHEPYYKYWKDEDGTESAFLLSSEVTTRLFSSFTLPRETFDPFVSLYAEYKFMSAMKSSHPFTVSCGFYKLFKAVASVTHELFADAINASGVLPNFCSINRDDLRFGSIGPWESVEKSLDGGAGHPPFLESTLLQILEAVHQQIATGRPYFRAFVLPYEEGTPVYSMIDHELFGAEVVAVIQPEQQAHWFTHQLNYFRHDHRQYSRKTDFSVPVCIAIWINEEYRLKYPPPMDVEECFLNWEHNDFGSDADVVNYAAVDNCFPERCRGGHSVAWETAECTYCK